MPDKNNPNIPVSTGLVEGTDPRDLLGADIVINWELIPEKLPVPKTKLNQGDKRKTRNSCTMAGALLQVGQLYDFEVDNSLLEELCDYAIKEEGRDIDQGRFISAGCNTVKNFVKQKFGYEVIFASYRDIDKEYIEWNKRGGLTGIGYRMCPKYTLDYLDDAVVQGNGDNWEKTIGGHRTNNYLNGVLDSYYGRTAYNGKDCNQYEVKYPNAIRKNGIYYPGMFIFFKKDWVNNNYQEVLKKKKEKIQIDAFCEMGSLIWKYFGDKPNLREDLELFIGKVRKEYGLKMKDTEEEKENSVLLGVLQKIKDKEINSNQIKEIMRKLLG